MGEGTNCLSHLNVLNGLITQLTNLGVKIENEDKEIVLLNSFPSSYENLASIILHSKDSIELKDVTSALLLNKKMRKKPKIHGHLSSRNAEAEFTKGAHVTMVDPELVKVQGPIKIKSQKLLQLHQLGHCNRECPNLKTSKGESSFLKNDYNTAAMVQK